MKTRIYPSTAALCGLCAACVGEAPAAHHSGFGKTIRVERGTLSHEVQVDGALVSPSSRSVSVDRVGWEWSYNIAWTATEGTQVKPGDVILRLDSTKIEKELLDKERELELEKLRAVESALEGQDKIGDATADIASKELALRRAQLQLVDNDSVSANEKKRQRLAIAAAEAALNRAKEHLVAVKKTVFQQRRAQQVKVEQAQQAVDFVKAGLDKLELKAPQEGILLFPQFASNGGWEKARPGIAVQVGTAVARVATTDTLLAELKVPEVSFAGIRVGTPGTLSLDVAPEKDFQGSVLSIANVPSTAAEREGIENPTAVDTVRQFLVRMSIDGKIPAATPGLSVRARLQIAERQDVLMVPIDVLALKPRTFGSEAHAKLDSVLVARGEVPDAAPAKETDDSETAASQHTSDAEKQQQAFVYAKQADSGNWQWLAVQVGVVTLSHAEILGGLQEGTEVRSLVD